MACDICGKKGTPLNDLRSVYQTPDIQAICNDCETDINKRLRSIQDMTTKMQCDLLKRFMFWRKEGAKP